MEPTDEIWADFTSRLAGAIDELEPDEFLVLAPPNNRFVQLSVQDLALRVESASDQYLETEFRLSTEDLDRRPATMTVPSFLACAVEALWLTGVVIDRGEGRRSR